MQNSYLARIVNEMVDEGWGDPPRTTGQAADELLRRVDEDAEGDEFQAVDVLGRWKHEGARREWNQYSKREKQQFWIAHNGEPIGAAKSIPLRQAVAGRREDGTRDGSFQRPLMWAMSWEEWEASLDSDVRLATSLGIRVEFKRMVLALRREFPEARTPLEACELAGLDIDNLKFDAI